jgi:capsular polysaccharide biosynthesis protein
MGAPELQRPGPGPDVGDTSLSEAVATLRKRRWILILAAVLGASYGCYKAFTQPKVFVASSTVQVHNGASNAYRVDTSDDYEDDSQTRMNTEVFILKSDTLLETVAGEMDLVNNPDFWGTTGPLHLSMDNPNVRESALGTLKNGLQVSLVPHTELIHIDYTSPSAKLSADIVNKVVGAYIQRSLDVPASRTQKVSDWFSKQLDDLKSQVETAQEEMMKLQRKMGTLGYDSTHNQLQASLSDLLSAEGAAKIARITAESRYRMVAGMDVNTIEGSIETTPGTGRADFTALADRGGEGGIRAADHEHRQRNRAEPPDGQEHEIAHRPVAEGAGHGTKPDPAAVQGELSGGQGGRGQDRGGTGREAGRGVQAGRRPGPLYAVAARVRPEPRTV